MLVFLGFALVAAVTFFIGWTFQIPWVELDAAAVFLLGCLMYAQNVKKSMRGATKVLDRHFQVKGYDTAGRKTGVFTVSQPDRKPTGKQIQSFMERSKSDSVEIVEVYTIRD